MTSIHDNPERAARLMRAIKETIACHENPLQIGFVSNKLPHDFDLSDDELAEALREMKLLGEATEPAQVVPAVSTAPARVVPAAHTEPAQRQPPEARITQTQARKAVEAAHKRLGEARVAVIIARNKHADTNAALALAITGWQRGEDPMTSEQRRMRMVREMLASEQARKQALHDAGIKGTRMRTDKFPAQNMVTGQMGHKGNSRGAYPSNYHHRTVGKPTAFQGKLPSDA